MKRPIYIIFYDGRFLGLIFAFIAVFVVIPLVLPIIDNLNEQVEAKHQEVVARIEEGDVDEAFGDVSEFVNPDTCYSQLRKYDGQIVSFTGYITDFIDTGAQVFVSIDSNLLPLRENDSIYKASYYAKIIAESEPELELETLCESKTKVLVVGQVSGTFGDNGIIELQNCKIIQSSDD